MDSLDAREAMYVMEIDLDKISAYYGTVPKFTPIPKYSDELRDLALVMDKKVLCGEVEDAIKEACKYVKEVTLFDVYEGKQIGEDKKSMAFTIRFVPAEEEFTGEIIDGYVKKILKNLKAKLDVELRS